jgi:hypothetical protein
MSSTDHDPGVSSIPLPKRSISFVNQADRCSSDPRDSISRHKRLRPFRAPTGRLSRGAPMFRLLGRDLRLGPLFRTSRAGSPGEEAILPSVAAAREMHFDPPSPSRAYEFRDSRTTRLAIVAAAGKVGDHVGIIEACEGLAARARRIVGRGGRGAHRWLRPDPSLPGRATCQR